MNYIYNKIIEASRGAVAQSVILKPTGCGFDPRRLSSATQHAMPPEFGRKRGTECLNIRFPLLTLLCAGYSVKLIYNKIAII